MILAVKLIGYISPWTTLFPNLKLYSTVRTAFVKHDQIACPQFCKSFLTFAKLIKIICFVAFPLSTEPCSLPLGMTSKFH